MFHREGGSCYTVAGRCTSTEASSGWTIHYRPDTTQAPTGIGETWSPTGAPATTAPSTTPFEIVSGGAFCQIGADPSCVTDGDGVYDKDEDCTIRLHHAGFLTSTEFDIHTGDVIMIGTGVYPGFLAR